MRRRLPRALLLVIAAGLLALLLAGGRSTARKEAPYWTLAGRTAQGKPIRLRLDARGRVPTFDVRADIVCSWGARTTTGWHPAENGAPARFGSRGPRFDATEFRRDPRRSAEYVSSTYSKIRGVVERQRATGVLELYSLYRYRSGRRAACASGRVRWTAD